MMSIIKTIYRPNNNIIFKKFTMIFGQLNRVTSTQWIWALCATYLLFQIIYIPYGVLAYDEFFFAHHIYSYLHHLPYRDFLPYKTVLGYYLMAPAMLLSHDILRPFYLLKYETALINTSMLLLSFYWAKQFFNPKAVLLTLSLIISGQLFLIYASDLRVDMLCSWLGLFALLSLLSRRIMLAGFMLGIGFLIEQKALWFWLASNCALLVYCWESRSIKALLLFNLGMVAPISVYMATWSSVSSFAAVWQSVFQEAYAQARLHWYANGWTAYWTAILLNGPLLFALWPLTWMSLIGNSRTLNRRMIAIYAAVMIGLLINYEQLFPYNFVFAVPFYLVLYSDFFTWYNEAAQETPPCSKRVLFWFCSFHATVILCTILYFRLPNAYVLMAFIPIFYYFSQYVSVRSLCQLLIMLCIIFTGILYPLTRLIFSLPTMNGSYQKKMIRLSNTLLQNGEGYFAGTALLYPHEQAIPGLKNLIDPQIAYFTNQTPDVEKALLASLELAPVSSQDVIETIKAKPVKFYVNDARIDALPPSIKYYLQNEFRHYWGSIYLYAPRITVNQATFFLKFNGLYQVISQDGSSIFIDHTPYNDGVLVKLTAGTHTALTRQDFRLALIPDASVVNYRKTAQDQWKKTVKPTIFF